MGEEQVHSNRELLLLKGNDSGSGGLAPVVPFPLGSATYD